MGAQRETIGDFTAICYETLPSTQITARDAFQSGLATDGDVVIAAEQTAGYGRRGRAWQHQSGNVYLTLTRFFTPADRDLIGYYGFVASLAVAQTCRDFLQGTMARVVLKWPNDVLVNDAKIAGMLLEKSERDEQTALLLGIGVNLVTPHDVDQPVSGLDQFLPQPVAAKDFILVFLRHMTTFERRLRDEGFASLRQDWLQHAKGQGGPIVARLANGTVLDGTFLDLDHHGALLLQMADHTIKTITAADIFFTK